MSNGISILYSLLSKNDKKVVQEINKALNKEVKDGRKTVNHERDSK